MYIDMSKGVRDYCYTIHDYDSLPEMVRQPESVYQIYGYEVCPETQRKHIQGYIYFKNAKTMEAVKKVFKCNSMHLEPAKGTAMDNKIYCSKEGDFREVGTIPEQGKRNDITQIKDLVKSGKGMKDIIEVATNYQSLKIGECLLKYMEKARDWKTKVIWIWGASGTGKTRQALDVLTRLYGKTPYIKTPRTGKWFDVYDADEGVILDEVDRDTCYSTLKELCDRYPCRVETKGGMRQFLAKTIYITSLGHPEVLFSNKPQNGKEILRRIDEIIFLGNIIENASKDYQDDDFSQDDYETYSETSKDNLC